VIRFALAGDAESVKLLEGTMVSVPEEVTFAPASDAVRVPVAAPAGMTKVRLVAVALAIGAESVPPACAARATEADVLPETRFVPVTVTLVPIEPDVGVKLLIVGGGGAETVSGRVPEVALAATFCTATVKEPELARVAGPVTDVALFAVSAEFGTVHGAQPVPVKRIWALAGSKFEPETVIVNGWAATGSNGVVDRLLTLGPVPLVIASGRVAEVAPVAVFCTATVKVPKARVAGPVTDVAVFAVRALLATVQGVQPVPVMTI